VKDLGLGESLSGPPRGTAAAENGSRDALRERRRGLPSARVGVFWSRVTGHGEWVILELGGELDWTCTTEIRGTLLALQLRRRGRLALDLRAVSFMDSGGIRVILQASALAEERGARFAVIRGPQVVHGVLELVGLDEQLHIVADPSALD
jgi:anti-anti-sigma factor